MTHTLVVLAGGLARRYGALKQLEPVGPTDGALLDYTIHDALSSGFGEIVLVVRESTEHLFREHLARFWPGREFRFALQTRDGRPAAEDGTWKPWGTAHAVLAAAELIGGRFAVLNADDFYGRESIRLAAGWLAGPESAKHGAMVGFRLRSTLSPHGAVSRAVCTIRRNTTAVGDRKGEGSGDLVGLIERTDISSATNDLDEEALVSMNLWALPAGIARPLRAGFEAFRAHNETEASAEFLLPEWIGRMIEDGRLKIRVLESKSEWMGLTFAGDRPAVQRRLAALVESGVYPAQFGAGPPPAGGR